LREAVSVGFQVVVLGDTATGKSSLAKRLLANQFDASLQPNTGALYLTKHILLPDGKLAKVLLWDLPGHFSYRYLLPEYCRRAHAALLVYDAGNERSFAAVQEHRDMLKTLCPEGVLVALVGNKRDSLPDAKPTSPLMQQAYTFSQREGVSLSTFVSAQTGQGVRELFVSMLTAARNP
jgi:Ras-related protein Rab-5C